MRSKADVGGWHTFYHGPSGIPLASGTGESYVQLYKNLQSIGVMPAFRRKYNYISRNSKRQRVGRFSRARMRLAQRRKNAITSGRGVTFEHDRQFMYRYKRMPRRKRRRWLKFKGKVDAVSEKKLGSRTVLFNKSATIENNIAQQQGVENICLYGWDSTTLVSTWHNDLRYISRLENVNTDFDQTVTQDVPILFQSAIVDITMRNVSSQDGQLNNDATLEVDVYEWRMKREAELNGSNYQTGQTIFTNTALDNQFGIFDNNTASTGTPTVLSQRGCTPWECTTPLSAFKIKILKKTKFFIRSGQTATYQLRDPKRHAITKRMLQTDTNGQSGFNLPGITKNILIVFKSVPGVTVGSSAGQTQEKLIFGVTRKYLYNIRGLNRQGSIYVNR
jgi:hypothetical protein